MSLRVDAPAGTCHWATHSAIELHYHDTEWGMPCRNDARLFEYLILDTFQAGLSWYIILKKREAFREAFAGFEPEVMATFGEGEVELLLRNEGIIRNRLKILGAIGNAQAYLKLREQSTLSNYVWSFVQHTPMVNNLPTNAHMPTVSAEAVAMAKGLKKLGFKFCGPITCYAFMQAAGLVNDHLSTCPARTRSLGQG